MAGIMHENDMYDDIIVTATMFNSQKDRKNVLLMNEAMKVAKRFLFDDFPVITKDLAQHQVALFCRSTDIINLKEIEQTIAQMNGPAAKERIHGPEIVYGICTKFYPLKGFKYDIVRTEKTIWSKFSSGGSGLSGYTHC